MSSPLESSRVLPPSSLIDRAQASAKHGAVEGTEHLRRLRERGLIDADGNILAPGAAELTIARARELYAELDALPPLQLDRACEILNEATSAADAIWAPFRGLHVVYQEAKAAERRYRVRSMWKNVNLTLDSWQRDAQEASRRCMEAVA